MCRPSILLIEAFYGGSHKQLMDLLVKELGSKASLHTLPAKKWHWRARTSALYFADAIPKEHSFRILFTTSVLNLAELSALRPDLGKLHKIVYFHENQIVYPVQNRKDRDIQYGYNEVLTSLVADKVFFNSHFNQESFLTSLSSFFKVMSDHRPKGLEEKIRPRCSVLYYPIQIPSSVCLKPCEEDPLIINSSFSDGPEKFTPSTQKVNCTEDLKNIDQIDGENSLHKHCDIDSKHFLEQIKTLQSSLVLEKKLNLVHSTHNIRHLQQELHIIWPHRWEHDKGPETFFSVMFRLKDDDIPFKLSVLGESYKEKPDVFHEAKERLKENIIHWDYQHSKKDYFDILCSADVVVSTADHEFFGVAMLEAVSCGCFPLCPRRLVYPEIFPDEYLYNTTQQLYKKLKNFCKQPYLVRKHKLKADIKQFTWETLKKEYMNLFECEH